MVASLAHAGQKDGVPLKRTVKTRDPDFSRCDDLQELQTLSRRHRRLDVKLWRYPFEPIAAGASIGGKRGHNEWYARSAKPDCCAKEQGNAPRPSPFRTPHRSSPSRICEGHFDLMAAL